MIAGIPGAGYRLNAAAVPVERVTVPIVGLPAHLHGYTLGVLTDLHIGPLLGPERVAAVAERLAAMRPDLVVVAGDLVSAADAAGQLDRALAPVQGALAVPGNWDYRTKAIPALLGCASVRFLLNEGVEAAPGLWIAGLDDALSGRPDIGRALAGAPEGAVRILLAHEPDVAARVRAEDRIALQISGHSHGGQIVLPLLGAALLPTLGRRYPTGLARAPHCQVYTSRGLGVAHLPIRWNCPPEITLITLVQGTP